MTIEDRHVLSREVLGQHELALAEVGEELGDGTPDAAGAGRERAHEPAGPRDRVRIEELADPVLAVSRARLGRDKPLIGINGAQTGLDVARMMLAGASAVEIASVVQLRGYSVLSSAVAEFVSGQITFTGIAALVEATLDAASRRGVMREPESIADAIAVDHNSRSLARDLLPEIAAKAF